MMDNKYLLKYVSVMDCSFKQRQDKLWSVRVWQRDWQDICSPVNTVHPLHLSPPLTETIKTTAAEYET